MSIVSQILQDFEEFEKEKEIYKNIYVYSGYKDRDDYLNQLAIKYEVKESLVHALATICHKSEDFDGLIELLEDFKELKSGR